MSATTEGNVGSATPSAAAGEYSTLAFVFRQLMAATHTATIVQVKAVTNAGGVAAAGKVDVQPMIHQLDGAGNIVPHGTVYGLPYFRLLGGTDAVILDPKVGDIGIAVFADRDASAVVATQKPAAPGSARRNDYADGFYLGGILNGTPNQYIRFSSEGIEVVSPTKIHLQAPNIEADASTQFKVVSPDIQLQGAVHITGAQTNDNTIVASGDVTGAGTSLHMHKHGGVQTGGGQTSAPV